MTVAFVAAEADPWWSVGGYSTPYAAYNANPTVYGGLYKQYMSTYSAPASTYAYAQPATTYAYAQPTTTYAYAQPSVATYAHHQAPVGYMSSTYSTPYNYGSHYIAKREAEADADAEPWYSVAGYSTPYAAYVANPTVYGSLYNNYMSTYAARPATAYAARPVVAYNKPAVATYAKAVAPVAYRKPTVATIAYNKPATYVQPAATIAYAAQPAVATYANAYRAAPVAAFNRPVSSYGYNHFNYQF